MLRKACEKRPILKIENSLVLLLLTLSTRGEGLERSSDALDSPRDVVTVHGLSSHLIVTMGRFTALYFRLFIFVHFSRAR
jgi:hypothetical protein